MEKHILQDDFDKFLEGENSSQRLQPYLDYFKAHHHIILRRNEIVGFNIDDFRYLYSEFLSWGNLIMDYDMSKFNTDIILKYDKAFKK